jgi:hypothetical protein
LAVKTGESKKAMTLNEIPIDHVKVIPVSWIGGSPTLHFQIGYWQIVGICPQGNLIRPQPLLLILTLCRRQRLQTSGLA